uniref:Carboxypeptidase inhibitor n=1 Tax=Rhipicephalus zambeziensis TaxID=60191 RepID=A0A224Y9S6_9ACAR
MPMKSSTSGKIFVSVFSVMMFIEAAKGTWAPKWKPPKDKAFPLCGVNLVEGARCRLPAWCTGGYGSCCRGECICPGRYNPCKQSHRTTTTAAPTRRPRLATMRPAAQTLTLD